MTVPTPIPTPIPTPTATAVHAFSAPAVSAPGVTTVRTSGPLPPRFWAKVRRTATCWLWTGATSGGDRPYGRVWDGTRVIGAHRWAWEAAHGPIPAGMTVDHVCQTPLCVRAAHLRLLTNRENVLAGSAPGPRALRTNRCKRGHEFTVENTRERITPQGVWRTCRACESWNRQKYRARASGIKTTA